MPTTAEKLATRCPARSTVRRASSVEIRIRHGVVEIRVTSALIQPVSLFGRSGNRTSSQRRPSTSSERSTRYCTSLSPHSESGETFTGLGAGDIAAGAGLGDPGAAEDLPFSQRREPPLFLLAGAEREQAASDQRRRHAHQHTEAVVNPGDLLDYPRIGDVVKAKAAPFGRHHAAEESQLRHFPQQVGRKLFAGVIFLNAWSDPRLREIADQTHEGFALGRSGSRIEQF